MKINWKKAVVSILAIGLIIAIGIFICNKFFETQKPVIETKISVVIVYDDNGRKGYIVGMRTSDFPLTPLKGVVLFNLAQFVRGAPDAVEIEESFFGLKAQKWILIAKAVDIPDEIKKFESVSIGRTPREK